MKISTLNEVKNENFEKIVDKKAKFMYTKLVSLRK